MNQKSLGQVVFEAWMSVKYVGVHWDWEALVQPSKDRWEKASRAVIREYLKRQKSKQKRKVVKK